MAISYIWDFVDQVNPDYNQIMDIRPQISMTESGEKNQLVHTGDDNSEEIITFSDDSVFTITIQFNALSESDAGTIFDFYHDKRKANGIARSFLFINYHESKYQLHTYVVRFASSLPRTISPAIYKYSSIKLRVLGKF